MASGDAVQVLEIIPPATLHATLDTRAGGSTPSERVIVWEFDDATDEYLDFKCRLANYTGGGLTLRIFWSADTATSGVCRWGAAIRRLADDLEDVDDAHVYDFNDADATAASVSGELDYLVIEFTDGADMDSLADGEVFILRVRRAASHVNDTLVGDAQLWAVVAEETA